MAMESADAPKGAGTVRVVLTTAPDATVARRIADAVVGERLAACVNVLPGVTSVYRWEGAVQRETEVLLVVKATEGSVPALRDRIVELHPYDVPEVLVLPVVDGHLPYLEWVGASVGREGA